MTSDAYAEWISEMQSEWTLEVAHWFHDIYESLAPRHGWETQEASRTAWEDLPSENRTLMLATVQEVLGRLMVNGWVPPEDGDMEDDSGLAEELDYRLP